MALYSQRHYENLAFVIRTTKPDDGDNAAMLAWERLAIAILAELKRDNPKFKPNRFCKAVGVLP